MRTRKQRLVSAILALAMLFAMVPAGAVTAFADDVEKTDTATQLKYTVDANNEVTITGYAGDDKPTSITIPAEIGEMPVVAIGDYAFNAWSISSSGMGDVDFSGLTYNINCEDIKNIQIDANLRSIGQCAFSFLDKLETINIPSSVITIGNLAFYHDNTLTSVELHDGLKNIGKYAFSYAGLTSLKVPGSVKVIEEGAFMNSKIQNAVLENGVETIAQSAFTGCTKLTTITVPKSLKSVEAWAFGNIHYLETVNHDATREEWSAKVKTEGNNNFDAKKQKFNRVITFNTGVNSSSTTLPETQYLSYAQDTATKPEGSLISQDGDYKFKYWSSERQNFSLNNVSEFDFTQEVTKSMTLYAAWAEKATLSQTNFTVKVGENTLGGDVVPKFTYDGSAKTAAASGTYNGTNIPSGDITVKYYELNEDGSLKDSTGTTDAPSKVGHYVVKLDVAMSNDYKEAKDVDGGWKFEIVKADLDEDTLGFAVKVDDKDLSQNSNVKVTYTGNKVKADVTNSKNLTENTDYTVEYYKDGSTKPETDLPKEPGKYVVKIRVKATENTNEKLVTNDNWKFEIVKADLDEDALGFAVKVDRKDLSQNSDVKVTYTGNNVEADVSNTAGLAKDTDYTVEYYKDGSTTPETNLPEEPGKYVVKIRVAATSTTNAKVIEKDYWQFEIVKKSLDENNFELIGDKKWTEGDEGKNVTVDRTEEAKNNGVGKVTEVKYYPVNDDGTLGEGSKTLPAKPGKYQVGITVADSDHYEGGELTSDKWQFEIEKKKETPAPNPDDDAQKKVTITVADGELYVNGEKKPDGTAEVAEGDTVRIELPEEKKTQGELVFGGWVLGQEELLDDLKANGFTPGAANTEFTMPALPEGTQLTIRAQYVTPEQAGQSDDFISTAAAVVGGAALTGLVAWQGYNIFAEVYMKQFLPVLPQNRQELALALWQDAEKPAAVESALYTDVDEDNTDAQTAARWAVENELLKPADKDDENIFKPYKAVSVGQVYRAWNKAQKLMQQ